MKIHVLASGAQLARLRCSVPQDLVSGPWPQPGTPGSPAWVSPGGLHRLELQVSGEQALILIAECRRLEPGIGILASDIGQSGQACQRAYDAGADACFDRALHPAELDALCLATARWIDHDPRPAAPMPSV